MNIWSITVALLLISAAFSCVLRRLALKGLEYHRRFARATYFEGQEAQLVEVVRNDHPYLIPWLRVESKMPASMRFGHQENLDVVGRMYHRSVFMLTPYQQITRRHNVRLMHRGAFDIGNATLTVGDALSFGQETREVQLTVPVLVYPRLLNDDELPAPFSRMLGDYITPHSLITDPFLVSGIRAYRPGDQVRDIHWPATARMQETQVRTHDRTAQTRLFVIINSQLREDQWDAQTDYEQPFVEQEIRMAATLCIHMLRAGLSAGFAANMPQDENRRCTVLLPVAGTAHEDELLSAMARLRVMMSRKLPAFIEEDLHGLTGLDILLISPYDGQTIREQLRSLRMAGNTTRLYVMDQGEVAL